MIATVTYTPAWANGGNSNHDYQPSSPEQFGEFAGEVAARYASEGVHTFEIWNEPNIGYWRPVPDPARYAQVLCSAYAHIHAVDPQATVLTGGTSPAGNGPTSVSPQTWLTDLYADGARGCFDAVAHHPYVDSSATPVDLGNAWDLMYDAYPPSNLRAIMSAHGDGAKRIWATEVGCNREALGDVECSSRIAKAFRLWQGFAWAGVLCWFTYWDPNAYGLVTSSWTPRPAWHAYQASCRRIRLSALGSARRSSTSARGSRQARSSVVPGVRPSVQRLRAVAPGREQGAPRRRRGPLQSSAEVSRARKAEQSAANIGNPPQKLSNTTQLAVVSGAAVPAVGLGWVWGAPARGCLGASRKEVRVSASDASGMVAAGLPSMPRGARAAAARSTAWTCRGAAAEDRAVTAVAILIGLAALALLAHGLFSLWLMLYAWNTPEAMRSTMGPRVFAEPELSFTVLVPAREEEAVIAQTMSRLRDAEYPPRAARDHRHLPGGRRGHDRGRLERDRGAQDAAGPSRRLQRSAVQQAARAQLRIRDVLQRRRRDLRRRGRRPPGHLQRPQHGDDREAGRRSSRAECSS